MVKVDMAQASNGPAITPPVAARYEGETWGTYSCIVRRNDKCAGTSSRESKWRYSMVDRRSLGDVGIAVLLALPTAVLAHYPTALPQQGTSASTQQTQVMAAERSPLHSRFGLRG
jgi:hypothetical protein